MAKYGLSTVVLGSIELGDVLGFSNLHTQSYKQIQNTGNDHYKTFKDCKGGVEKGFSETCREGETQV